MQTMRDPPEVSVGLVDHLAKREGIVIFGYDAAEIRKLMLVYNAEQNAALCICVCTVTLQLCNAVVQHMGNLIANLSRVSGYNGELIGSF